MIWGWDPRAACRALAGGAAAVAIAAALLASPARAQSEQAYQIGAINFPGDMMKLVRSGQFVDAGGILGDIAGYGVNPFAITDKLGLGLCSYTTATLALPGFNALCLGHDSSGNGLITLDSYGVANATLFLRLNGTKYAFPGAGNGNVAGPSMSADGDAVGFNGASGTLLRDLGAPPLLLGGGALTTGHAVVATGVGTVGDAGGAAAVLGAALSSGDAVKATGTGTLGDAGAPPALSVPTLAALEAISGANAATMGSVRRLGFAAAGDGPDLVYVWNATFGGPAPDNLGYVIAPGGASTCGSGCWVANVPTGPINTGWFGDVGNGTYNYSTGAVAGTDDTAAIQAALNVAIQLGRPNVCVPNGGHKTSDTLQMGYGQASPQFPVIDLAPCDGGRAPYGSFFNGPVLLPTATDRCAINIQQARDIKISGIELIGQNYSYGAAIPTSGSPYPIAASGWLNPTLAKSGTSPGGLQQYSPYAAICIDAYSGSAPSAPYPNVTFPSWTGLSAQYGKAWSSDTELSDLYIDGFAVGIVATPNNVNSQDDFVKIQRVIINDTVFGIAIDNNQSRNVRVGDIQGLNDYTLITNADFGCGCGLINGPIENIALGEGYQFFHLAYGWSHFDTIRNIYGESVVRIGQITAGGANNGTVDFDGCDINFADTVTGVVPAALIETADGVGFNFHHCSLQEFARIETLIHSSGGIPTGATIDGGAWYGGAQLGTLFNSGGVQQALNYTGSVFVGAPLTIDAPGVQQGELHWLTPTQGAYMASAGANPATGQLLSAMGAPANGYRNPYTEAMSAAGGGFVDVQNAHRWQWAVTPIGANLPFACGSGCGITGAPSYTGCDTVTFGYNSGDEGAAWPLALALGDILYHENTGTLFVITNIGSVSGGTQVITLRQMNNMQVNSSGACATNTISDPTLAGNTAVIHTGVMVPQVVLFGTFTSGSASVTNVQAGAGYHVSDLANYLAVGDRFLGYYAADSYFQYPYVYGTTIAAISEGSGSSGGTVTLSANATISGRYPILELPVLGAAQ